MSASLYSGSPSAIIEEGDSDCSEGRLSSILSSRRDMWNVLWNQIAGGRSS